MLSILISIVIFLIIVALLWWIISVLPLPAPIKQIANIAFVVIVAIYLIYLLLPYATHGTLVR